MICPRGQFSLDKIVDLTTGPQCIFLYAQTANAVSQAIDPTAASTAAAASSGAAPLCSTHLSVSQCEGSANPTAFAPLSDILANKKLGNERTGEKEESEKRKCPGTNANVNQTGGHSLHEASLTLKQPCNLLLRKKVVQYGILNIYLLIKERQIVSEAYWASEKLIS